MSYYSIVVLYTPFSVAPTIVEMSGVKERYGNEPATFTASFVSSSETHTSVSWLKDDSALSGGGSVVVTAFVGGDITRNTSLGFSQLRRTDAGLYTVLVNNSLPGIPLDRREATANFTVRVHGKSGMYYP